MVNLKERAASLRADVLPLMETLSDKEQQVLALTVAHVTASVLDELAPALSLVQAREPSPIEEMRRKALEKMNAIRVAAATGNWKQFDQLAGLDAGTDPAAGNGS